MKHISEKIEMIPIGYVENDYLEPKYNEEVYQKVSRIVLKKELTEGLYRLNDFEKIYVLFYFSKSKGYNLTQHRRYDGKFSGVFASRSPNRPNGIGLTIVKLLKIEGNVVFVKGLDAINGTPVLDIKPYMEKVEKDDKETGQLEGSSLEK